VPRTRFGQARGQKPRRASFALGLVWNVGSPATVVRDARPKSEAPAVIDGFTNIYAATAKTGAKLLPLDSGINAIAPVQAPDGRPVAAIVIASSQHKVGRVETPWQDTFDPDRGYVCTPGTTRRQAPNPARSPGNRLLLDQLALHVASDETARRGAVPMIFFERVGVGGKQEGFP
jgi:hypothetical protein